MKGWKEHFLGGLVVAGMSISSIATFPRVAHADELGFRCDNPPSTVPSNYGYWETQRFWIDKAPIPGESFADPIRFTVASSNFVSDSWMWTKYQPTGNPTAIDNYVEYKWLGAYTYYECFGDYPHGTWIMFSLAADGKAVPVYGEDLANGSGSTGGGGEGDQFCIEYYDWWYDSEGWYHEQTTGYECFGYET